MPKVVEEKKKIEIKDDIEIDIFKDLNDLIYSANLIDNKQTTPIAKKKIVVNKKQIKKKKEKIDFTSNTSD